MRETGKRCRKQANKQTGNGQTRGRGEKTGFPRKRNRSPPRKKEGQKASFYGKSLSNPGWPSKPRPQKPSCKTSSLPFAATGLARRAIPRAPRRRAKETAPDAANRLIRSRTRTNGSKNRPPRHQPGNPVQSRFQARRKSTDFPISGYIT